MLVYCMCPLVTAVLNDLGSYEGFSAVLDKVVKFGFPYFIGRLYFNTTEGMRDLAVGVFIGGLIYVPLCLYEVRMSPTLHSDLYGFRASSMEKAMRYGGYRPIGFMWTYLALVMWMTVTTVIGFWLWRGARIRRLCGRLAVRDGARCGRRYRPRDVPRLRCLGERLGDLPQRNQLRFT